MTGVFQEIAAGPPAKRRGPRSKDAAWTPAETAILRRLWGRRKFAEIRAALPGRTVYAIRGRAAKMRLGKPKDAPPRPKTTCRPCLVCGKPFASEGIGHRVCDTCKKTANWRTGDWMRSSGAAA